MFAKRVFSFRQLQTSSKGKSKLWTGFCHQVQSPNSHGSIMNWIGPLQDTHSSHTHQKVAKLLESSQRLMREGLKSWVGKLGNGAIHKQVLQYSPKHTHTQVANVTYPCLQRMQDCEIDVKIYIHDSWSTTLESPPLGYAELKHVSIGIVLALQDLRECRTLKCGWFFYNWYHVDIPTCDVDTNILSVFGPIFESKRMGQQGSKGSWLYRPLFAECFQLTV